MIHHHFKRRKKLAGPFLSICLALILLCSAALPAYATAAEGNIDNTVQLMENEPEALSVDEPSGDEEKQSDNSTENASWKEEKQSDAKEIKLILEETKEQEDAKEQKESEEQKQEETKEQTQESAKEQEKTEEQKQENIIKEQENTKEQEQENTEEQTDNTDNTDKSGQETASDMDSTLAENNADMPDADNTDTVTSDSVSTDIQSDPDDEIAVMSLEEAEVLEAKAPGGNELDQKNYKGSLYVRWDTTSSGASTGNKGVGVAGVTLDGKTVPHGESGTAGIGTGNADGNKVATYYPDATTNTKDYADLVITAQTGYYVTRVVVACVDSKNSTCYNCNTWRAGNEYNANFDLSNSTIDSNGNYTLTIKNLCSDSFCHASNSGSCVGYYILIVVAPVPTPLYVEYDYGTAEEFLTIGSDSAFYQPTWTTADSKNTYNTGGILTEDTQFKYAYTSGNNADVSKWKHYANGITEEALEEAARAGYYFTGWKATWYNSCSASSSGNTGNSGNNNYVLSFSTDDVYSSGAVYQPGDFVILPAHVRLVAQWSPYELEAKTTVTLCKIVTGELGDWKKEFAFNISVTQGQDDAVFKIGDVTYSGSAAVTLKHNDQVVLSDVPVGATVVITESVYDGYKTSYVTDEAISQDGTTATIESVHENGHTVVFTNDKKYIPDVGIVLDSFPYTVTLLLVAAGATVLVFGKRRSHRK